MTVKNVSGAELLLNHLAFLERQALYRHFVLDTLKSVQLAPFE